MDPSETGTNSHDQQNAPPKDEEENTGEAGVEDESEPTRTRRRFSLSRDEGGSGRILGTPRKLMRRRRDSQDDSGILAMSTLFRQDLNARSRLNPQGATASTVQPGFPKAKSSSLNSGQPSSLSPTAVRFGSSSSARGRLALRESSAETNPRTSITSHSPPSADEKRAKEIGKVSSLDEKELSMSHDAKVKKKSFLSLQNLENPRDSTNGQEHHSDSDADSSLDDHTFHTTDHANRGTVRLQRDRLNHLRHRNSALRHHASSMRIELEKTTGPVGKRWILNPQRPLRKYWDLYMLLVLVYVATVSVFVISFLGVVLWDSPWFWIERIIDLSFAADIVLSFITAYEHHGKLEYDPAKIARHYISTWLVPDVLSTFPWEVFSLLQKHADGPVLLQLPRFLRLLRVLKLVRIVRVLRLEKAVTEIEVALRLKYGYIRMLWLVISVSLIAHWFACLFYFFGAVSSGEESWISVEGVPQDLFGLYITALYFSVYTITTIGFGDVTPENTLERTYTTFIMLLGAATFAFVLSQVGNLVEDLNVASAEYRRKIDNFVDFSSDRGLDDSLVYDVRRYFQHRNTWQQYVDEKELLDALSTDLRVRVTKQLYEKSLSKSTLLCRIPEDIRDEIYMDMKRQITSPEQVVYKVGDSSDAVYAIVRGEVDVTAADGSEQRLGPGDVFGEDEIVFGRPRRGKAQCVAYCDLAVYQRPTLMSVLRRAPAVLKQLETEQAGVLWGTAIRRAENEVRFWLMAKKMRSSARRHIHHQERLERIRENAGRPHAEPTNSGRDLRETPDDAPSRKVSITGETESQLAISSVMEGSAPRNDSMARTNSVSETDTTAASDAEAELSGMDALNASVVDNSAAAAGDARLARILDRPRLEFEFIDRGRRLRRLETRIEMLLSLGDALQNEVTHSDRAMSHAFKSV